MLGDSLFPVMFQRLKGTVQCKRSDIQGSEARTLQSLTSSTNWCETCLLLAFTLTLRSKDGRTGEPQYKKRFRYTTNGIFHPSNSKMYEKEPRYNDNSLQRTYFASYLTLHYICYMEVPLLSFSEHLGI